MFGLGHPFTVYSAESEGWLIEKLDYYDSFIKCFAFTTTGEAYFLTELEWYGPNRRGVSSDDTITAHGHLKFVSLAKARRCTFGDRSDLSVLERDYLRPALRQVLEHEVTKGIFILWDY